MKCFTCESNVIMPFNCKFCSQNYCDEHRLPEDHECEGLQAYKDKRITNFRKGKNLNIIYSPQRVKTNFLETISEPKKIGLTFLQPVIDLIESNPNFYVGITLLIILLILLVF